MYIVYIGNNILLFAFLQIVESLVFYVEYNV